MAQYDTIPAAAKKRPTEFTVNIAEEKLQQFKQLIKLSPVGPETYENLQEDHRFGVTRKWLTETKAEWEKFDWRAHEKHINSFPNYTLPVTDDDGRTYTIHFAALFSTNPSAVPIALFHGWPGSFLEFLPMMSLLKQRYPDPAQLPYHFIVPSLPGFGFSARPPLDKDWTGKDTARLMNKLMVDLGFESGYIAQGGDIGAFVSRILVTTYDSCKAMHLNFCPVLNPPSVPDSAMTPLEKKQLARGEEFRSTGRAYAMKHGTRPATIGLVLSASPIALLSWIGEKFLSWTDANPSVDTILESVSLYWLTDTFPTSIYTYREHFGTKPSINLVYCDKPFGYSFFPMELMPVPKAWAETTGNLVWHKEHTEGGHFAAIEKPDLLLSDVEEFVKVAWNGKRKNSHLL